MLEYDLEGRLIKKEDATSETITYTYYSGDEGCGGCGSGGQIASKTDSKDVTIEYEYDIRNRLAKIEYGDSSYVTFTYDNNGNRLKMYDSRLSLGDKTFRWEYDALNRINKEKYPGGNYLLYSYDAIGRRISVKDPDGNITKYN